MADEPTETTGPDERDQVVAAILREAGAESATVDRDTLARRIVHAIDNPETADISALRQTDEHGNVIEQPEPAPTTETAPAPVEGDEQAQPQS